MSSLRQVAKTLRLVASILEGSTQKRLDYVWDKLSPVDQGAILPIVFTAIGVDDWDTNKATPAQLLEDHAEVLSRSSIVDPYIPWLANQFRKGGVTPKLWSDLTRSFRAIAIWASETRTDIGKVGAAEAVEKAQAYVTRAARKGVETSEANPVIYEFADGHKVFQLKTDEALKHEGDVLKHCVGTYCEQVAAGDLIFSLRTKEGKSIITIHAAKRSSGFVFTQMLGENNRKPSSREQSLLLEFVEAVYPNNASALLLAGKPARDIDFNNVEVFDYDFRKADLSGADLSGKDLSNKDFSRATMIGTKLVGARLDESTLYLTNLTQADLSNATTRDADLTETNLREAILIGTNFAGTYLDEAYLFNVKYDKTTKWPGRFTPPPSR